jgi:hypothetical protein
MELEWTSILETTYRMQHKPLRWLSSGVLAFVSPLATKTSTVQAQMPLVVPVT